MAFAIETSRGVNQRNQIVRRQKSPRGISLGTAIIGTGVVAFAWAVATAMTLQSVAVSFSPTRTSLQSSLAPLALARLDTTSQRTTHTSPRLVAAMTPIVPASSAIEQVAAVPPIARGGRLPEALALSTDTAQQAPSPFAHIVRPRQEDVTAALRLALAAPSKAIQQTIDAAPIAVALVDRTAPSGAPAPAAPAPAVPADRPVQLALADPRPSTSRSDAAASSPAAGSAPSPTRTPVRLPPVATRDPIPQARPDDNEQNMLPTTATAMVENDTRRTDVTVEQTFGLVMPTATPDDMVLANVPLPTMRPAPLPDAATTPAAKLTRPSKQQLAYARPDAGSLDDGPSYTAPPSLPNSRTRVAIYDITAGRVYLPNGEALEAHSGLGPMIDNPKYVNQKNRGPTPPHTYNLTLRESLFHGVEAIRLNPVNAGAIYGRDGLLAHTYMLGKRGDSNGCVSFKDYRRFLSAFKRGDVTQLVVVPSLGSAAPKASSPRLAFWR